jgi:GNAT superfamily N-acetyltransferase
MESKINRENNENITTKITTISGSDLTKKIFNQSQADERFLNIDNGGVFRYFLIDSLTFPSDREKYSYPIVEEDNKIVGLAELQKDPRNKDNLWVKFVSVDPAYQNKGYASSLIKEIFLFAKNNNKSLEMSSYNAEGYSKLKKVIQRCGQETGVPFIEKGLKRTLFNRYSK